MGRSRNSHAFFVSTEELRNITNLLNLGAGGITQTAMNRIKTILHLLGNPRALCTLRVLFFFFIIYCIGFGIQLFSKWNNIPHQCIKADLKAMGVISDSSSCHFRIRINAGRKQNEISPERYGNLLYINHSTANSNKGQFDDTFYDKFNTIAGKYREELGKMQSFYVLDYSCSTTIDIRDNHSEASVPKVDYLQFCYTDAPVWEVKADKSFFSGSGFVAFSNYTPSPNYVATGKGELEFNTNVINLTPNFKSPWDITQSTYEIYSSCRNIRCDTVSIEFYGATLFSDMYPKPDKITMSSINFTSPDKIQEIMNNGLKFHAEFIELKELSAMRLFILTAIMSAMVAFIVNIIYGYLYGRD